MSCFHEKFPGSELAKWRENNWRFVSGGHCILYRLHVSLLANNTAAYGSWFNPKMCNSSAVGWLEIGSHSYHKTNGFRVGLGATILLPFIPISPHS